MKQSHYTSIKIQWFPILCLCAVLFYTVSVSFMNCETSAETKTITITSSSDLSFQNNIDVAPAVTTYSTVINYTNINITINTYKTERLSVSPLDSEFITFTVRSLTFSIPNFTADYHRTILA